MAFTLSAVIVTLNEESNIGRCIDSLKEVADEIIVLDSFSIDKTMEICVSKKVTFIQRAWQGYSLSKNYGNSLATKEYLLSIDADEALSKELAQSILYAKQNFSEDGFSFNRLTNYCGQWIHHCGWYPDAKVRLFKKSKARWSGEIHEELKFNSAPQLKKLHGDLLHYSFPTIASHIYTLNSFSAIAAKDAFAKNKKATLFVHLLLNPLFTFFKKYILQKGFLDGYYGFVVCSISSFANFIKFVKIRELEYQAKLKKHSSLPE